jgi:beta-carotene 3-hydroxylase
MAAFLLMEPVAYLAHRLVMHGRTRTARWHVPHHRPPVAGQRLDTNDGYPAVLAAATVAVLALATARGWSTAVWAGVGVSAYGAAYLVVHDLYIHRRLRWLTWTWQPLERVREAHRIHHLWGGEPYGFLFPVVPADLRARARAVRRDPLRPVPPS